ncbi:16S rRNA (cytosine(1402)-N(4))-methyltransferase RsmH [Tumebacillus sp. ITR2]|uniref:Ribosomal RNA small subunit methyltransferase H n=1 Tax=Tumebacillus amylolyticus TaxID=2801339 RepID=A0ABS1JCL6_9BACL|nr:16S rRNA (cytosine(1402)-N(4))-methyltransferase RsmH [Tumebacillus amylolyticus]MBL0388006.1 16S rRNA (cytosine(1402)-N(4))-methyltransferase RsmH [Tumebacillus amylolyticus]
MSDTSTFHHISVFAKEAVEALQPEPDHIYVDCTLGGAGHSGRILEASSPTGRLIAIDQDLIAIANAEKVLAPYEGRFTIVHSNFRRLADIVAEQGLSGVDGVLFDLGVSSPQLDEGERGFSYQHDAPLDMRMDKTQDFTARDLVNEWSQDEIMKILYEYGEEKWSKRIAEFIVRDRAKAPIETTGQLVDIIKAAIPAAARREGGHPAKRTFQGIRIAVNDELNVFAEAIQQAIDVLNPGGRVAIITFHSLEDRMAKLALQEAARGCICPPQLPICQCNNKPRVKLITRKPIVPSEEELAHNPRARSAKLRIAEKL